MTYPNEFRPEQQLILNEMISAVEALEPGQSLTIEHKDKRALEYRRYLLYAWLSPKHSNKKELYRISTLSPDRFQVVRRNADSAIVHQDTTSAEQFVIDHLLDVVDDDLALSIIRKYCKEPAEQIIIYREWHKKQ